MGAMVALLAPDAPAAFDFFLIVMLAVLPVMAIAIVQARRKRYGVHAVMMSCAYVLFLIALIDFEWTARTMPDLPPLPMPELPIHLCFAIPALVLWTYQLLKGKKAHANPKGHARLGRIVFALLVGTVATGAWVYFAMFE